MEGIVSASRTLWDVSARNVRLALMASLPPAANRVIVTASVQRTMNATSWLASVTVILKPMVGSVINVKSVIGTSPTVKLVTATVTLQLATLKLGSATSAQISQPATTVIDALKATMAIQCSEARSDADLAVVQTQSLQVIPTQANVLWFRAAMTSFATAVLDTPDPNATHVTIITLEILTSPEVTARSAVATTTSNWVDLVIVTLNQEIVFNVCTRLTATVANTARMDSTETLWGKTAEVWRTTLSLLDPFNNFWLFLACECDVLGTNGTIKHCDRYNGQCPCLPNVDGTRCDECAKNHWKIASGEGCEACNCDEVGARSEQCNAVS